MNVARVKKRQKDFNLPFLTITKLLLLIVASIVVFFSLHKLKEFSFFPIKKVSVYGVQHVNQQDIQYLVQPLVSGGFFAVDVSLIKERLLQLSWINEVVVKRVWPAKIIITLVEKQPLARWNTNNLLSTQGDIFNPEGAFTPAHLPQLYGPPGEQIRVMKYYLDLTRLLLPLRVKINRLELTADENWILTLNNKMKITLGHKDILTRLDHFVKVYPKIIADRAAAIDYVDLRYSNGVAVRWKTIN